MQIKVYFKVKTGTSAFRRLSHRRHPNKEVALNCMCRYGDAVTVICDAMLRMSSIKTNRMDMYKISNTVVHLSIYDIFVSGILRRVCLYAHKSQLTLMDD